MNTIAELNEENFHKTIAATSTPAVVDVYAPWCGPCKMLSPVLEQLAVNYGGSIRFFKVNVDETPGLASRFEITGVPTLLFFKNGEVCDRVIGLASPRTLLMKLEALAAKTAEVAA